MENLIVDVLRIADKADVLLLIVLVVFAWKANSRLIRLETVIFNGVKTDISELKKRLIEHCRPGDVGR